MNRIDWLATPPAEWEALAQQHATPFYLFDADAVCRRIDAVRAALDGRVGVYYAVKANPNLGLLRALHGRADGLDISSAGELDQALLAGHDPATFSFAGPAKTDAELAAAIRAGVGCISAESLREIDACARIAAQLGRPARLLVRVNPLLAQRAYGIKMGGRAVQFGIDEEDLPQARARIVAAGDNVDFVGLHAYVGSQCFDPAAVAEASANALRIADGFGLPCRKINLGGGFGFAHAEEGRELDVVELARHLLPVLREHGGPAQLFFELGRYLAADAGIYVTRVVDRKTSRGKVFVTCDGGLNHHLAAAGTFGAALRGNFPLRNLSRPAAPAVACNIAGPSCNPTDLLGVDARIAEPAEGDLIGVATAGAYGLTASPLLFLGHPTPVELVRAGGTVSVGRRSHPIADFN